jgi:hypothetical protein
MCGNKWAEVFGWCAVEDNWCSGWGDETFSQMWTNEKKADGKFRLIKSECYKLVDSYMFLEN